MDIRPGLIVDLLIRMGVPLTEFDKGDVLITEGSVENTVYILYEGEVSVTQFYKEIATIQDQGAMLGEIAALLGVERTARVTVTKPSTLFVIDNLAEFLGENSPAAMVVMRNMAQQVLDRDKQHSGIYVGLKKLRERYRSK